MALGEISLQEKLVGLFEMVMVLGLSPFRINFPQFCLHSLELRVVITLFKILENKPVIFSLLHLRIKVLLSQTSNSLHLSLFELAFAVAELALDSLVVFDPVVEVLVSLLELMEVEFWVVFPKLLHSNLLLLTFPLFLPPQLQSLLLVNLQLFVLPLLGRQLVVWYGD